MAKFGYVPSRVVDQRHRAANARSASSRGDHPNRTVVKRQAVIKNVQPILDLGSARYITIRNVVYRCPPVPYKLGQRVMDIYIQVTTHAKAVVAMKEHSEEESKRYYIGLDQLARLMWTHLRPIGRFRRVCWHLGLTKNRLRMVSEQELRDVANFFLLARTRSHVQFSSELPGNHNRAS